VTRRQPCLELTRLLDALGDDIVAATDAEVRQMHGRQIENTVREVRQLIRAAWADRDEDVTAGPADGLCKPATGPRPAGAFRRPSYHQRH